MKRPTDRATPSPGRGRVVACAALALGLAISCGPEPGPGAADGEPPRDRLSSQGTITATLHRFVEPGADAPFEEFALSAAFPRYRPEDAALVEGLLGERVPEIDVFIDQCESPAPTAPFRPRGLPSLDGTAIELADVGDLSVEYVGQRITLTTQTFPDLLRVIDGVTYGADARRGVQFLPAETYTLHASGAEEVARFDVSLDAPEDLGDVEIDGVSPSEQQPLVRRGAPFEISWEGEGGYGDEVIVTMTWSDVGAPYSVSCRMRDDGHFVVPGEVTSSLRDPLAVGEAEMSISRVRQTAFRAEGLESGEFGFVLSTSFLVRFDAAP